MCIRDSGCCHQLQLDNINNSRLQFTVAQTYQLGGFRLKAKFLLVLRHFLQPLARLSKTLQSSSGNIAAAMAAVKATTAALRDDFSLEDIKKQCQEMSEQATAAGVKMEQGSLTENQKNAICEKYHKVVVENLDARFSDAVTHLCEVGNGTIVPNGSMPVQYCSLFTVLLVFR